MMLDKHRQWHPACKNIASTISSGLLRDVNVRVVNLASAG